MLLSKTFGQQDNAVARFRGLNRTLASLQIRQAMVGRWFFMIIGTIFSITPAFVYWLAASWPSTTTRRRRPSATSSRSPRSRVGSIPAGPAAQRPGRDPGRPGPVRPDLEYLEMDPEIVDAPNAVAMDPAAMRGSVRLPGRVVPLPNRGSPVEPGPRRDGGRPDDQPIAVPALELLPAFALESIAFEARPGELVALVGRPAPARRRPPT